MGSENEPWVSIRVMGVAGTADQVGVDYVFVRFVRLWIEEGRFPREELRIRWWIAAAGGLVVAVLAVALVLTAID